MSRQNRRGKKVCVVVVIAIGIDNWVLDLVVIVEPSASSGNSSACPPPFPPRATRVLSLLLATAGWERRERNQMGHTTWNDGNTHSVGLFDVVGSTERADVPALHWLKNTTCIIIYRLFTAFYPCQSFAWYLSYDSERKSPSFLVFPF